MKLARPLRCRFSAPSLPRGLSRAGTFSNGRTLHRPTARRHRSQIGLRMRNHESGGSRVLSAWLASTSHLDLQEPRFSDPGGAARRWGRAAGHTPAPMQRSSGVRARCCSAGRALGLRTPSPPPRAPQRMHQGAAGSSLQRPHTAGQQRASAIGRAGRAKTPGVARSPGRQPPAPTALLSPCPPLPPDGRSALPRPSPEEISQRSVDLLLAEYYKMVKSGGGGGSAAGAFLPVFCIKCPGFGQPAWFMLHDKRQVARAHASQTLQRASHPTPRGPRLPPKRAARAAVPAAASRAAARRRRGGAQAAAARSGEPGCLAPRFLSVQCLSDCSQRRGFIAVCSSLHPAH